MEYLNLLDRYRTSHPATAEHKLFSSLYETFTQIDYLMGHRVSLTKFQRTKSMQKMFFDHSRIKLEISNRKISGKVDKVGTLITHV